MAVRLPVPGAEVDPRRRRAVLVLGILAVLLISATGVDALVAAPDRKPLAEVPRAASAAGIWYCPVPAGKEERGVVTVAAAGEQPSLVAVDRYTPTGVSRGKVQRLEPGNDLVVAAEGDEARQPLTVRWAGGAAVATYRSDGARTAAAPCETSPAETWYIPGFDTTLGSRSRLHLFNPFGTDAVVRLVFATPDGPVRLVLSDSVVAEAGATTTLDLARFQPEIPDLGVVVEVLSGRIVAQGELWSDPPGRVKGTSGRVLLPAAPEPSLSWYAPYAQQGEGSESWLAVLNPGERDAAVEIRVSAPAGGAGLTGEVSVPAGGMGRVELAEASSDEIFGVSVASVNAVPVVVTRMTALRDTEGRSGVTAALGAPSPALRWALAGGGTEGRSGRVSLYNPGPDAATVDLRAPGAPDRWTGMAVPPNGQVEVELGDASPTRDSLPVLVAADQPVVAGLRSTSQGERLRPWTMAGLPAASWTGPARRPAVRLDPTLSTRVATPATPREALDALPTEP